MKRSAFILAFFLLTIYQLKAQVVLNEIYTDPGSGKHEFFELYNTSSSAIPENLDCYTIVAYYEESPSKTGFYVMDLPNMTIPSRGYFTGASASPFNVQGQSGLTANFNWNAMPAGGALYKMERSGATYNSVAVPANLNDFFYNKGGGGTNYSVMIYKNGVLLNAFFGGSSSNVIPPHILAMPNLPVTMNGSCTSFSAVFSTLTNKQGEYVTPTPGNDNGYIRTLDGKCGTWAKGASTVNHTPGASNGSAINTSGDLTITTFITCSSTIAGVSIFNYNITGGTTDNYPAIIEVYRDRGIIGSLDAADSLLNSRTIINASAGTQSVNLPKQDDKVILVAKSPAGCIDVVLAFNNTCLPHYLLPVNLSSFNGTVNIDRVRLSWILANNENASSLHIERSFNGRDYLIAGEIPVTKMHGHVEYEFVDMLKNTNKAYYRLKFTDKTNQTGYSNIISLISKKETTKVDIKMFSNPVVDNLVFSYPSAVNQTTNMDVYNLSGNKLMSKKLTSIEGINHVGTLLPSAMNKGTYLLILSNNKERMSTIFLKN